MPKDIQTIKSQFQVIQNETIESANTAIRVGGAGYDLAEYVGENRTGIIPHFNTEAELNASIPNPSNGEQAWVGTPYPGTVWNVVDGIWTDTTVVPDVNTVNLSSYMLNGGSTKTGQQLDDEKASKKAIYPYIRTGIDITNTTDATTSEIGILRVTGIVDGSYTGYSTYTIVNNDSTNRILYVKALLDAGNLSPAYYSIGVYDTSGNILYGCRLSGLQIIGIEAGQTLKICLKVVNAIKPKYSYTIVDDALGALDSKLRTDLTFYRGVLYGNMDSIDLDYGSYMTSTNVTTGTLPDVTTTYGILSVMSRKNYISQMFFQMGGTGKVYVRSYNNFAFSAWSELAKISDIKLYKGTYVGTENNIDTLKTEGVYLLNKTSSGTYPSGATGTYGLLVVQGSSNFITQEYIQVQANAENIVWRRNLASTTITAWKQYAYKDYVDTSIENLRNSIIVTVNPPLSGKKIVFMGDSIVEGKATIDIVSVVAGRTGATCTNIGIGGTQMANHVAVPDYNPFSFCNLATAFVTNDWSTQEASTLTGIQERVTLMKSLDLSAIDVLVVMYGHNDRSNGVSVGDGTSVSNDEFYGAMKNGVNQLWTKYSNLQIILIAPYDRIINFQNENVSGTIKPYVNAIIEYGNTLCVPVLNLYNTSGINSYTTGSYLEDNLHPKIPTGYDYLGKKIGGWLSSVL